MKRVYNIPDVEIIKIQSFGAICIGSNPDKTPTDNPGSTGGGGNAAPRVKVV